MDAQDRRGGGGALPHGETPANGRPCRGGSGRLILVSNRLPATVEADGDGFELKPSAGGLAGALWPMHRDGDGVWVGWTGALPENRRIQRAVLDRFKEGRFAPVTLSAELESSYSHGFSNAILWPLLHYRPHYAVFDPGAWQAYRQANQLFFRAVEAVAQPDDTIWVHDYHLMLLPGMLRRRFPDARIGYFLHTPFPSSEIFRILPWRRDLLEGLLGADLIGFHIYDYLRHFRQTVRRVLGIEVETDRFVVDSRVIRLGVFPVGIDADRFYQGATEDREGLAELARLRHASRGIRLILGVDRMDYSKGIPERLQGYERFLERFPSHHGQVEFLQVGVPSRTDVEQYRLLRRTVEGIVGRINGRFGTPEWTPVKYLYRPISFAHLCALYRHAAVGLVTPVRDGMNLVAKEFVACQKGSDGVLVLSEFAGAAAELTEALFVNPFDTESMATALHQALVMPRKERTRRMEEMTKRVWRGHIRHWAPRFLGALAESGGTSELHPARLTGASVAALRTAWKASRGRVLLLDYDGTLRGFVPRPELARPGRELQSLLRRLAGLDGVEVVIISGRDRGTLNRWFGSLPITLVAEHGRWLKEGRGRWTDVLGGQLPEWLGTIKEMLEEVTAVTPGSFVEEKSAALAWHFRTANAELAELRVRALVEQLRELSLDPPLDILHGNKVLEIRVMGISKASVLVTLLAGKPPIDFFLALGDDETDEELFAQLPPSAWTVHVGSRPSRARFSLPDPRAARSLLADLAGALEP